MYILENLILIILLAHFFIIIPLDAIPDNLDKMSALPSVAHCWGLLGQRGVERPGKS